MQTIFMGIFLILHGLVHLLYAGQSYRLYELKPGMLWPNSSWAFSRLLGDDTTRLLTTLLLALAALGFMAGGVGLFFRQEWWRLAAIFTSAFSSALYFLLWDGKFQALDAKGGVGLLINLAILAIVFVFKWPA